MSETTKPAFPSRLSNGVRRVGETKEGWTTTIPSDPPPDNEAACWRNSAAVQPARAGTPNSTSLSICAGTSGEVGGNVASRAKEELPIVEVAGLVQPRGCILYSHVCSAPGRALPPLKAKRPWPRNMCFSGAVTTPVSSLRVSTPLVGPRIPAPRRSASAEQPCAPLRSLRIGGIDGASD